MAHDWYDPNLQPAGDIFLAEITSVGANVADSDGNVLTPYGWKELQLNPSGLVYDDHPMGREGASGVAPEGAPAFVVDLNCGCFNVGDLVWLRIRGQTNVYTDYVYDIIGSACATCTPWGTDPEPPPPSKCCYVIATAATCFSVGDIQRAYVLCGQSQTTGPFIRYKGNGVWVELRDYPFYTEYPLILPMCPGMNLPDCYPMPPMPPGGGGTVPPMPSPIPPGGGGIPPWPPVPPMPGPIPPGGIPPNPLPSPIWPIISPIIGILPKPGPMPFPMPGPGLFPDPRWSQAPPGGWRYPWTGAVVPEQIISASGSAGNTLIQNADGTFTSGAATLSAANRSRMPINYIANADFEDGTTGWSTYADAAGTTPVDATGGATNITIAVDATTYMEGAQSLKITKSAANRQGEGISYDFTVPDTMRSKAVIVRAMVRGSTTVTDTTNGVLRFGIYDVTGAALLSGFSRVDSVGTAGSDICFITRLGSSSSSYRLFVHIATTDATAIDFHVDSFHCEPYNDDVLQWRGREALSVTGATTIDADEFGREITLSTGGYDVTVSTLKSEDAGRYLHFKGDSAMTSAYVRLDFGANSLNGNRRYLIVLASEQLVVRSMGLSGWQVVSHVHKDWTTYTPTINAVTANPTKGATREELCAWKRQGQDMLLSFFYEQTAAGAAGTGTYLFVIPTPGSSVIDTGLVVAGAMSAHTDMPSTVGSGTASLGTGTIALCSARVYDTSNLQIQATSGAVSSGHYALSNTNVHLSYTARFPIVDW